MKDQILVDSSVWIAATRLGGDPQIAAELGELLLSGRAAMTEPVWLELFQGIKSKARRLGSRKPEKLAGGLCSMTLAGLKLLRSHVPACEQE